MINNVFLDPYVLAVPRSDASPNTAEGYADTLGDWDALGNWDALMNGQEWRLWKSRDTSEALYTAASLPTHDQLDRMLRQWGIRHKFYPEDILKTIEKLLRNAATVEDLLELDAFAADEVESIPAAFFSDRPEQLNAHCKTVVMLALLQDLQESDKSQLDKSRCRPFLLTRDTSPEIASATFTGNAFWQNAGHEPLEQRLSGEVSLCSSPSDLLLSTTPNEDRQSSWVLLEDNPFRKGVIGRTQDLLTQIEKAREYLALSPMTPYGNRVKVLEGDKKGLWRYRIGPYRLVYRPDAALKQVELLDFGPRGSIYD